MGYPQINIFHVFFVSEIFLHPTRIKISWRIQSFDKNPFFSAFSDLFIVLVNPLVEFILSFDWFLQLFSNFIKTLNPASIDFVSLEHFHTSFRMPLMALIIQTRVVLNNHLVHFIFIILDAVLFCIQIRVSYFLVKQRYLVVVQLIVCWKSILQTIDKFAPELFRYVLAPYFFRWIELKVWNLGY